MSLDPNVSLTKDLKSQSITHITTALGLVVGLAWNDAIQSAIKYVLPGDASLIAKFVYAVIATFCIIILIRQIKKIAD